MNEARCVTSVSLGSRHQARSSRLARRRQSAASWRLWTCCFYALVRTDGDGDDDGNENDEKEILITLYERGRATLLVFLLSGLRGWMRE